MDFKIGYDVRPKKINNLNEVIFENSIEVEVSPTEEQCKAYGFIFNTKCYYPYNDTSFIEDTGNFISGSRNNIGENAQDSGIIGIDNLLNRETNNDLIVGDSNKISDNVNNTILSGTKGDATATNSIVLGGNSQLAGTSPLGSELVENGDFSEIGAEEILNGDFSEEGSEEITNGSFDTSIPIGTAGSGWKKVIAGDCTVEYANGGIKLTQASIGNQDCKAYAEKLGGSSNLLIAGKSYKVTYEVLSNNNITDLKYYRGGSYLNIDYSIGIHTFYFQQETNQLSVFWNRTADSDITLDNISIKEVGQDWVVHSGTVDFNNNAAIFDINTKLYQTNIIVTGKSYKVTYEITENIGGMTLRFYNGGAYFYVDDSVGVHTVYFVGSGTGPNLFINTLSGTSLTLNSVSVKEVGQYWKWSSAGADWSIGSSPLGGYQANSAGLNAYNSLFQEISGLSTVGKTFSITFTVSNYVSGTLALGMGGYITANSPSSNGTHTVSVNVTNSLSNNRVYIRSNIFNGSVTNISVKEQFPYVAPRQDIKLMYGGTTTNDTSTPMYLNAIVDKYFNIPINTAMSFNADILALRVGGTASGDNGDYASWIERGVIINKDGVISVSTTNTPIVSSGTTTGWIPSSADPTGSELITNGDFATDTNWTKGTGWTISGGSASSDGSTSFSSLSQASVLTIGKSYKLVVDINLTSGQLRVQEGGNILETYISTGTNTVTYYFTATATSISFKTSVTPFLGSIDNVSVKEIITPSGTNYNINVLGARDTTIEWASTINFTQIKTNITLENG
jgi:hypothetical protein